MKNERGFLGPIGDDLPSLIPLVFALMLFFGAFGVAFSTFNLRGKDFDLQIEALRISTDLKGNSYFSNYAGFRSVCDSITAKGIKFRVGLFSLDKKVDLTAPEYYAVVGKTPDDKNVFKCENTDEELTKDLLAIKNPIVRDFPVALSENFIVTPLSLVIAIWR
jgi:hypothetical protein